MCRSASSDLISESTSRPYRPGRFRSSSTRSGVGASWYGGSRRRYASAWLPSFTTSSRLCRYSWNASLVSTASPSSSSTSSTLIARDWLAGGAGSVICRLLAGDGRRERQAEPDSGAVASLGVQPDSPAVVLDDPLGQRQSYAGARIRALPVQPLEDDEDLVGELRLDADPVVRDADPPAHLVAGGVNPHLGRAVRAAELHRVADQVGHQLAQQRRVAPHPGQLADRDPGLGQPGGGGDVVHRGQ